MKNIVAIILTLLIVFSSFIVIAYADTPTSGVCGSGLTWNYNSSTLTLTISGKGDMRDYSLNNNIGSSVEGETIPPWFYYHSKVQVLLIEVGITRIGNMTFSSFKNISSVIIPNTVKTIGVGAFCDCTKLNTITIPQSVTKIDSGAFARCISLTSITFPKNVSFIGERVLSGCSELESINVDDDNTQYSSSGNCLINTSNNLLIQGCKNSIIPNGIKTIGEEAFSNCTGLNSINLPNSVTRIEELAFYKCSSLTSMVIPNNVTYIDISAFSCCEGLKTISIPSKVKHIGNGAFENCYGLNEIIYNAESADDLSQDSTVFKGAGKSGNGVTVKIGEKVKKIPAYLFHSSGNKIISIEMSNGVNTIGKYAFCNCTGVAKLIMPDSVLYIGDYAFWACRNIISIIMPKNLKSIGNNAFYGCSNLTKIRMFNKVTSIGDYAFDSSQLSDIYFSGTTADWSLINIHPNNSKIAKEPNGNIVQARVHFYPDFTLTFIGADNQIVSMESVEASQSVEIPLAPNNGCTFDGWFDENGNTPSDYPVMPEKDLTFTAKYKLEVCWENNDGTIIKTDEFFSYPYYGELVVPEESPSKPGYVWVWAEWPTPIYSNLTIGGWFEPVEYQLFFYIEENVVYQKQQLYYKDSIEMPDFPMKEGFRFIGWGNEYGENQIIPSTMPDGDLNFYALWESISHESCPIKSHTTSTCTRDGFEYTYCSVCGIMLTPKTIIPSMGHDLIYHNGQASTCKEHGWKAYETCSRCDYTTFEELPLGDHSPAPFEVENSTESTCKKAGEYDEVVYCSVCGEELSREHKIRELGKHVPLDPVKENEVAATCTEGGNYDSVVKCGVCGDELSREKVTTNPAGHSYTEIVTAPTCTERGFTTYTCHCGDSYVDDYVAKLGHSFTNYIYNNDATTEKDGTETARCDRCNETDTRTADGTKIIPNSYNLTFDSNGGRGAPEKQTGNGSVLIPGSKPTRNGYTFLGWAETADATSTKYQPGGTINLNRNITLYAVWQENNTPENPVNPTENAKLNVKTSQTVDYKSNVTVTATATGVPTGYVLAIYEGNTFRTQGDNTKVSYTVGQMTSGKAFTVKVIDPSTKAVQKDSSGAELSKNCEIRVKTGFFDKLVAFFKGLFGSLPNVEVKP